MRITATPPESPAEEHVIGAVLVLGDMQEQLPPEALLVEAEYFTNAKLAMAWLAIQDVIAAGVIADDVTVGMKLVEWGERDAMILALSLSADCPCTSNLATWAALLVEQGRKRVLQQRLREAVDRGDSSASFESISAGVQDALRSAERASVTGGLEPMPVRLNAALHETMLHAANPNGARLVRTGLTELDEMVELRAKQLTIIAGRPGMGKSALAGNIASTCARETDKGPVAVFSLEMSATSLIMRMMSGDAGMSERSVGEMLLAGKLVEVAARMHKFNLHIDDRPGLSVEDIRRGLMALTKPRLVIVDYLQLARLDSTLDRHDLRIGAVTKGLKAISKDFDCHVIALAQLNRGVEQREGNIPRMSDLRDSGNIEEDADNVWLLYRPGYYKQDVADTEAKIVIGKQRHGRTGMVDVGWMPTQQRFVDAQRAA